jgi:hypothetical protein
MNKIEIESLQEILMGESWRESVINQAILCADSEEVRILLVALRSGKTSFESRMRLQSFVCRLSTAKKPASDRLVV